MIFTIGIHVMSTKSRGRNDRQKIGMNSHTTCKQRRYNLLQINIAFTSANFCNEFISDTISDNQVTILGL